jgi:hypothetical protein
LFPDFHERGLIFVGVFGENAVSGKGTGLYIEKEKGRVE